MRADGGNFEDESDEDEDPDDLEDEIYHTTVRLCLAAWHCTGHGRACCSCAALSDKHALLC